MVTGLTAMNPMTAVGFIGIGLALALTSTQRGRRFERRVAIVLASVVALIGIVRVLAIAGLYDAGIDRILFADKLVLADFGRPNQMAPNSAVNFIWSDSRWRRSIDQTTIVARAIAA